MQNQEKEVGGMAVCACVCVCVFIVARPQSRLRGQFTRCFAVLWRLGLWCVGGAWGRVI